MPQVKELDNSISFGTTKNEVIERLVLRAAYDGSLAGVKSRCEPIWPGILEKGRP